MCICSLFLLWPLPAPVKLIVPALVVNFAATSAGAEIAVVRWPVTVGAILSGLLIVFAHSPSSRVPLACLQALCGLVCLFVGLTHFALLPGPVVDLLGGALLTLGAVDRAGLTFAGAG